MSLDYNIFNYGDFKWEAYINWKGSDGTTVQNILEKDHTHEYLLFVIMHFLSADCQNMPN